MEFEKEYNILEETYLTVNLQNEKFIKEMSKFTDSITDVILKEINKINFYSKDFISELNIEFKNKKFQILFIFLLNKTI